MQRIIVALTLSAALIAVGFVVSSTPEPVTAETQTEVLAAHTTNPDAKTIERKKRRRAPRSSTTTSTTTPSSSTTSTTPSTSSTSSTSTTVAPDQSTTTIAETTTTTGSKTPSAIPATIAYPEGLDAYGGYDAILRCFQSTENFDCDQFGNSHFWTAPYLGSNLPYTSGYAWINGDRQGYQCAYGFLQDLSTGELIGRWAAILPPDSEGYAQVNDKFMEEAERYYDGEIAHEGTNELNDPTKASQCTDMLSTDIDYSVVNNDPDERPRVGFFNSAGQVVDIRDYSNTAVGNPGKFKLVKFDGKQAIVAYYPAQNNKAAVTFYYTAMGSGQILVDFNGTGPYG